MTRQSCYFEEVSQTALALLTLIAAGKSLDAAMIQSLHSFLVRQNDSGENRGHLSVFSDDEDESTEHPVILPFTKQSIPASRCHNGYGTLSLKNTFSSKNSDNRASYHENFNSRLRIFSPEPVACADADEDTPYLAATISPLKIYAE